MNKTGIGKKSLCSGTVIKMVMDMTTALAGEKKKAQNGFQRDSIRSPLTLDSFACVLLNYMATSGKN